MKERESLPLSEMLGIPKRGIIFSDLDGVWFDEDANFAGPAEEQRAVIDKAQQAGFWVVLNSDTGALPLANFAKELGASPLVLGENGMVIYAPQVGFKDYVYPEKPLFDDFRNTAITALNTSDETSIVMEGDATEAIRRNIIVPDKNTTVYLVNSMRECSFGVYTRRTDEQGYMFLDSTQIKRTEEILNGVLPEVTTKWAANNPVLTLKRYPRLGSCLVRDPRVNKALGVKKIIDQFPPNLEFYMIGDSLADAMDYADSTERQVTTCAVGNADTRLKEIASRSGGIVAPEQLRIANGARYIMESILQRSL